jgi:hypothetical protein
VIFLAETVEFPHLNVFTRQPGCRCSGGFYGPHCEFVKRDADPDRTAEHDDTFPQESIPEDSPNATLTDTNAASQQSGASIGSIIGITLLLLICSIVTAVVVYRRMARRRDRNIEQALRQSDERSQFVIPLPNTKTRRYRDFLGNPDIPDMDSPIRPTTSYHDHVFSNVEIL